MLRTLSYAFLRVDFHLYMFEFKPKVCIDLLKQEEGKHSITFR